MAAAKLKNIDLQNPHLLNAPAKFTIAGLVVAGVLAIGYFGVFKGQLETLSSEETKEVELKRLIRKRVSKLPAWLTFKQNCRPFVPLLMFY